MPGLLRLARRCTRSRAEAEDTVQSALLAAVAAERSDLDERRNLRWVRGAVVRIGAMTARSAARRRVRERAFAELRGDPAMVAFAPFVVTADLSPALELTARLVAAGCTRAELCWLLGVSDAALRQRIAALRRSLARQPAAGGREIVEAPPMAGGLRPALLPAARRAPAAVFASHDPDRHLFVAAASRIGLARQHGVGTFKGET